jgi:hypothetical protein
VAQDTAGRRPLCGKTRPCQAAFGLPLVLEVIKLLITIVGEISKSKYKYARGVRHSVIVVQAISFIKSDKGDCHFWKASDSHLFYQAEMGCKESRLAHTEICLYAYANNQFVLRRYAISLNRSLNMFLNKINKILRMNGWAGQATK